MQGQDGSSSSSLIHSNNTAQNLSTFSKHSQNMFADRQQYFPQTSNTFSAIRRRCCSADIMVFTAFTNATLQETRNENDIELFSKRSVLFKEIHIKTDAAHFYFETCNVHVSTTYKPFGKSSRLICAGHIVTGLTQFMGNTC